MASWSTVVTEGARSAEDLQDASQPLIRMAGKLHHIAADGNPWQNNANVIIPGWDGLDGPAGSGPE
jgi:hypothetical protein